MTGEEFRNLRDSLGMTQSQLGSNLGVSPGTIGNAEQSAKVRGKYAAGITALLRKHNMAVPAEAVETVDTAALQFGTPLRAALASYNYAPLGALADALALQSRISVDVAALYRMLKAAVAENDRLKAQMAGRSARESGDSVPRSSGRMTATEIAQRQVDTKTERQRIKETTLAQHTAEWNANALAKVHDCAGRWPFLSRADILVEIENLRNSPLGDHMRVNEFTDVWTHLHRVPQTDNPEDAHLFAEGEFKSSNRIYLPPMPLSREQRRAELVRLQEQLTQAMARGGWQAFLDVHETARVNARPHVAAYLARNTEYAAADPTDAEIDAV